MTTKKTKKYNGVQYDIKLIYDLTNGYLEIVAIHKKSKRKSSVTNLNFILSGIFEEVLGWEEVAAIEESWLYVKDKRKFKKLITKANDFFQRIEEDLEAALDDDMEQGGWNNREEG